MICPQCHTQIDDDTVTCPHCHAQIGDGGGAPRLIFCEGCGARLATHDRTCPKCGRPAPGILSTGASASDLAAGKTASFPRLTQAMIDADLAHTETVSARSVLNDSFDPSATNVLDRSELEARSSGKMAARKKPASDVDPYHSRKRPWKAIVAIIALLAIVGGGTLFVRFDPMGVMPGFYAWIQTSAREMFPSRAGMGDGGIADALREDEEGEDASSGLPGQDSLSDQALSDSAAFLQLTQAYESIVAINEGDRFADAIDSFNASYLSSNREARELASAGAFALRDELQTIQDNLDSMKLAEGSAYEEDRANVRELAGYMYERVDAICASWEVSLSYPDGERMADHQDEILAPMREAGNTALDKFYEHLSSAKPKER